MKNIFTIFLFLLGMATQAQVQMLSELSSSKFLNSKIIYEENGKDLFGYFILFQKDQTEKEQVLLEYVVLDKNLNKITSGSFLHPIHSEFLFKTFASLQSVIKNKNELWIATQETISILGLEGLDVGTYYRVIDLKSFVLSPPFSYVDFNKVNDFEFDKKTFTKSSTYPQSFVPTDANGFILKQAPKRSDLNQLRTVKFQEFRFYDKDLNEKWVYKYNQDEKTKSFYEYTLVESDGNDLIFEKIKIGKKSDGDIRVAYEIIDTQTGLKKYEISLDDAQNFLEVTDIKFENKKIIFYAYTNEFNKKGDRYYDKITGYAKATYDRETGKELDKSYFKWSALADKLDIDEFGKIKSYGYIHFIDFKRIKDGKTIVVAEGFNPSTFESSKAQILDLFIIVFNDKMEIVDYHKVDKVKNRFDNKVEGYGNYLENIGAFDYMYSQELDDDSYVYYYTDNEKTGAGSKKNPNWILGIITYVDGKFDFQKMPLKTKEGNITPFKAKKGYILLREDSEKTSELRLEKINY